MNNCKETGNKRGPFVRSMGAIQRFRRRVGALMYVSALAMLCHLTNVRPGKLIWFVANDGQPVTHAFIDNDGETVLAESALVLSTIADYSGLDDYLWPDITVRLLVVDRVVKIDASKLINMLPE